MDARIVCYFGNMNGQPLERIFVVNDPELAKYQICYFDRFIPDFEEAIKNLEKSFTFATLEKITVVVTCHGYTHKYNYKNSKLVEENG